MTETKSITPTPMDITDLEYPLVEPPFHITSRPHGKRRERKEADYDEFEGQRKATKRRKTTHLPFQDLPEVKLGSSSYISPGSGRGAKRTREGAIISSGTGFRMRAQDPWSSEFEEQRFAPKRRTDNYEFRGGQQLIPMTPEQAQSRPPPSSRAELSALRDSYFKSLLRQG